MIKREEISKDLFLLERGEIKLNSSIAPEEQKIVKEENESFECKESLDGETINSSTLLIEETLPIQPAESWENPLLFEYQIINIGINLIHVIQQLHEWYTNLTGIYLVE